MDCFICGLKLDPITDGGQIIQIDGLPHYVCRRDWPGFNAGVELQKQVMSSQVGRPPQAKSSGKVERARNNLMVYDRNPRQIVAALDEYVIGQARAKRDVAVALYDHHRIHQGLLLDARAGSKSGVELEKSNILMVGPSGSGKTLLARTLARSLGVPFSSADVTSLSPTGYTGNDVESVLSPLYIEAEEDAEWAGRGVVFLDEIDKIARKSMANASITRDVSGESVQHALLKMIEGVNAQLPMGSSGRKHPDAPPEYVDTTGVLFICGGAFEGFPEIVAKKMHRPTTRTMGLRAVNEEISGDPQRDYKLLAEAPTDILIESLIEYGFVPELAGRLTVIVPLSPLTKDEMRRALTEPKNAIVRQQVELFRRDGIELVLPDETLDAVVAKATSMKTGVRALRSLVKQATTGARFDLSGDKSILRVVITPDCIEDPSRYSVTTVGQLAEAV
jgi:ATP-dependent Clp protease ATP-binding subunit ClpX